jgi:putative GTP pyrophosphokinase
MAKKTTAAKPKLHVDIMSLQNEYATLSPLAGRFAEEVTHQLQQLIDTHAVALSIPIQKRIKDWSSIAEKLERKGLDITTLRALNDLVGLRIVVQFVKDIEVVRRLIRSEFSVVEEYDTGARLGEDQFGYSSIHFVITLPASWLSVPTMAAMHGMLAEVQLRTTAQHIWAAASHHLQYKREESVPLPIRRAIHRVSALLETVDLEFDRVLQERERYRSGSNFGVSDLPLNVDLIEQLLDAHLPEKNKSVPEEYADLMHDCTRVGIKSTQELVKLIKKHLPDAMKEDRRIVELQKTRSEGYHRYDLIPERLAAGVFYTHIGLGREILDREFGEARRAGHSNVPN